MTIAERLREWRKNPVVDLLITIVLAIAIAYSVQRWLVKPFRIPSPSMVTTLLEGDRVLTARFMYRFREPERGDIIVFYPNGKGGEAFRADTVADTPFVKRLIGLPGDIIGATDGKVYICTETRPDLTRPVTETAGCTFLDEPYVSSPQESFGPENIPEGRYFMMGDNRSNSDDSRVWGTITEDQMIGPAFALYWPITRIGPL